MVARKAGRKGTKALRKGMMTLFDKRRAGRAKPARGPGSERLSRIKDRITPRTQTGSGGGGKRNLPAEVTTGGGKNLPAKVTGKKKLPAKVTGKKKLPATIKVGKDRTDLPGAPKTAGKNYTKQVLGGAGAVAAGIATKKALDRAAAAREAAVAGGAEDKDTTEVVDTTGGTGTGTGTSTTTTTTKGSKGTTKGGASAAGGKGGKGSLMATILLGNDEKWGGDKGLIDFLRPSEWGKGKGKKKKTKTKKGKTAADKALAAAASGKLTKKAKGGVVKKAKGGTVKKKQGYNARLDESLGER